MLAQNFKTPVDLGISDAEFEALVKVLGMLEREEVAWDRGLGDYHGHNGFNMRLVDSQHDECGTVCCILGWCRIVSNDQKMFADASNNQELRDLFLYGCSSIKTHDALFKAMRCGFEIILPSEAAIALRNYLTSGEPRWAEAMAD